MAKQVTVNDVVGLLEGMASPQLAAKWDNVGLMLGRGSKPVRRLLLALDMTPETVQQAISRNVDLLVTHHPAIFHKLSRVTDSDWQQELLLELAENGIAVYSAHTNLDCATNGVNDVLAKKLCLTDCDLLDTETFLGRTGTVQGLYNIYEFADFVKRVLKADYVVVGDADRRVHRVAVCGGAGADLIDYILQYGEVDTLVTGDVKYHDAQRAVYSGLNIIDAGHQPTELPVLEELADRLSLRFTEKNWNISITVAKEKLLLRHM